MPPFDHTQNSHRFLERKIREKHFPGQTQSKGIEKIRVVGSCGMAMRNQGQGQAGEKDSTFH